MTRREPRREKQKWGGNRPNLGSRPVESLSSQERMYRARRRAPNHFWVILFRSDERDFGAPPAEILARPNSSKNASKTLLKLSRGGHYSRYFLLTLYFSDRDPFRRDSQTCDATQTRSLSRKYTCQNRSRSNSQTNRSSDDWFLSNRPRRNAARATFDTPSRVECRNYIRETTKHNNEDGRTRAFS